jgi:hypothetical protein
VRTGPFFVDAVNEVAAAALEASEVVSAVPTHADMLAFFPAGNAWADFVDDSGNFMAGRPRVLNPGHQAVFHHVIAETDTTGGNLDADLSLAGRGDFAFHHFEVGTRFRYYGNSHFWHGALPSGSQFRNCPY